MGHKKKEKKDTFESQLIFSHYIKYEVSVISLYTRPHNLANHPNISPDVSTKENITSFPSCSILLAYLLTKTVGRLFSVNWFMENIVNRFVLPQPLFPTTTTFFFITSIQLGCKEGIRNSVASVGSKISISYPPPQIRIDLAKA